ncbi:MAG TPA: hypothetical protein VGM75_14545 [Pseudonocardiaceae bacterium]
MTDGNWITDAYEILNSSPDAINSLADQWDHLSISLKTAKGANVDIALTKAASGWSAGGSGLTTYGQQLGDHLSIMADTAGQVATELHAYAKQLADARTAIWQLLETILIAVATSAIVLTNPELIAPALLIGDAAAFTKTLTNWVRPAGITATVMPLINAVGNFNSYADGLGKTFALANQELGALNRMGTMGVPQLPASPG